jgi:hypothetical protein
MLLFIMGLELARSGVRRANENRRTKKRLRTLEAREQGPRGGATDRHDADPDDPRPGPPAPSTGADGDTMSPPPSR